MRLVCGSALTLVLAVAPAAAEPLWQFEIHAGYGVASSGRGTEITQRMTPLTLSGIVAAAFNADPPLAGYGGLIVETLDRNAAGMVFGVQLHPHDSHLRFTGGGVYMVAPYTLWGASGSAGLCFHPVDAAALCTEVQLTAFVAGDDLPDGRSLTQGQLVLGLVFDAL